MFSLGARYITWSESTAHIPYPQQRSTEPPLVRSVPLFHLSTRGSGWYTSRFLLYDQSGNAWGEERLSPTERRAERGMWLRTDGWSWGWWRTRKVMRKNISPACPYLSLHPSVSGVSVNTQVLCLLTWWCNQFINLLFIIDNLSLCLTPSLFLSISFPFFPSSQSLMVIWNDPKLCSKVENESQNPTRC